MADESRQNKLASTRRKLKEYQQKTTTPAPTGGKKKKKSKESDPDHLPRLSPDPVSQTAHSLIILPCVTLLSFYTAMPNKQRRTSSFSL
ncbi:golgin subfamily A member 6C-like [Xenopus laevis]|uniref:Golgin subfamily A member 6C-like n=1 Tax=Xenopus laevis TaxID=8355 RepID=A0A8J1LKS1_XENLA|nr:golgin subfamily A member 6C-like [Xenopus laevis]